MRLTVGSGADPAARPRWWRICRTTSSVPVLLHLLAELPSLRRVLVMVQAEVADRLAAGPGSRTYGSPSVKAAWYGTVAAGRFDRTDGVLAGAERRLRAGRDRPACRPEPTVGDRAAVFAVVDAAFAQRRKTLRAALSGWAGGTAGPRRGPVEQGRHRPVPSRRDAGRGGLPRRSQRPRDTVGRRRAGGRPPCRARPCGSGCRPRSTCTWPSVTSAPTGTTTWSPCSTRSACSTSWRSPRRTSLSVTSTGRFRVPDGADEPGRPGRRAAGRADRGRAEVRIEIAKQIPVAGGMAGGSADAAAALLGCARCGGST